MFWRGKVSLYLNLVSYLNDRNVGFADSLEKPDIDGVLRKTRGHHVSIAKREDSHGISRLLNEYFEKGRSKTRVTAEWIIRTFYEEDAIWIVVKDRGGTVRGCIADFSIPSPYPNSLPGCPHPWGLVDWFCVHPLWRGKGVGSALLETLDYISYRMGRKASVFLKEGLPLGQVPAYSTFLRCRKAGTPSVSVVREGSGLQVHDYHAVERASGLPLLRVEGIRDSNANMGHIDEWERALDTELPPCWVFVSGPDRIDTNRGWVLDSLVSMYAFRWIPGKWLGSVPNIAIL
jgi:GNAT superfamily N-acetyltransferase